MLSNLPLDINYEGGQNLLLVLNDDHVAISIRVRLVEFTVEIHGSPGPGEWVAGVSLPSPRKEHCQVPNYSRALIVNQNSLSIK